MVWWLRLSTVFCTCVCEDGRPRGPRHTRQAPCAAARVSISFIAVTLPTCMDVSVSHHVPKHTIFYQLYPCKAGEKQYKTIFKREKESLVQEEAAGIKGGSGRHARAGSEQDQGAGLTHSLFSLRAPHSPALRQGPGP